MNTWDQERWDSACDEIHALYAERDALKAERDRLAKALREIRVWANKSCPPSAMDSVIAGLVNEALAGEEKT